MRACWREISASWPSVPSSDACLPIRSSSSTWISLPWALPAVTLRRRPSLAGSPRRQRPARPVWRARPACPARRSRARRQRRARRLDQLAAARIALLGLLGQRLCDHLVDRGGQLGAHRRERGRRILDVGVEHLLLPRALERWLAGEALVEEAPERVDVDAMVELLGQDLLRRHVLAGAHEEPGARQRAAVLRGLLAEPEVREPGAQLPGLLVVGDEDVRRLHVTVVEAGGVNGVERARHLLEDLRSSARG